jgi:hypothetical protein
MILTQSLKLLHTLFMLKPDVRYQMFSFIFLHIFGKFAIFENFEYFLNFVNMNQNGITVISIIVTGNQIF